MSGRRTETLERDAKMYMLHQQNVPHDVIAREFNVTSHTVANGVRRAIQDQFRLSAEEERMVMSDQIDGLMRELRKMLWEDMYVVGVNGKVAVNPKTGEPLIDFSHKRQTIDLLRKMFEQRAKLLGLNMPVRHRVEITDKMDDEIERLAAELALHGAGEKELLELPAASGGEVTQDGAD